MADRANPRRLRICSEPRCARPVLGDSIFCVGCAQGYTFIPNEEKEYMWDLKKLGANITELQLWDRCIGSLSETEIERLGEVFLSSIRVDTIKDEERIREIYEENLTCEDVPF